MKKILLAALLFVAAASAQVNLGLTPDWVQQFFDGNGNPLAGGFVYTCQAGQPCPGTPQTTYIDASGFFPNQSPIVLDANGRASIWLTCGASYKLVLQNSAAVTIKTVDQVSCAAFNTAGGGGTTNYWVLSGSTISNTNGSGAGNVSLGGNLIVTNNVQINGNVSLRSPATSHYATIAAANTMPVDQTWRWPATDTAGCLSSDGLGNLSFAICTGGGGGTPGGNNTDIQFNNSGAFSGTDNLQWINASQRVVLKGVASTSGLTITGGWAQADGGFYAVNNASSGTALAYDIIKAPTGGMHALSFTADNYVESGHSAGAPTATTGDSLFPRAGTLYCDTTSSPCTEKLYNGSAWVSLAAGGATSPGGSDTDVQFNSAGSFAGSANLGWSNSLQKLTVTGLSSATPGIHVGVGYVDSDAGFVALPGTATQFNSIRATAGGMAANSFTATTYTQTGHSPGPFSSAPPTPTNGDTFAAGTMSFDVAGGIEQVYNGSTWVPLAGGSGSPGGPTTSIQYNNAGTLAGNANLEWNNGSQLVTIKGITSTVGLSVVTSYVQSDGGFLASVAGSPSTPLSYNIVQAPTGGMQALSFTASKYIESGSNNGVPTATTGEPGFPHAGALYYDTGLTVERVYDGATWGAIAQQNIDNFFSVTQNFNASTAMILGGNAVPLFDDNNFIGTPTARFHQVEGLTLISRKNPGSAADYCLVDYGDFQCQAASLQTVEINGILGTAKFSGLGGIGYRTVCADSTGALLAPRGDIVGSYSTCPAGQIVTAFCNPFTLSSLASNIGCNLTALSTGIWVVTASLTVSVDSLAAQANYFAVVNGSTVISPTASTATGGSAISNTISQTWFVPMNSGDVLDIRAYKAFNMGTASIQGGNLVAFRAR